MELSFDVLLLLFAVAAVAGWVDVIAGGGGLLTIPAMVMLGMPPATAVATNKLQGSVGTLIATIYFIRKRALHPARSILAICLTFIGSVLGGWFVLQIDADKLLWILPILLIGVGLYFLFAPTICDTQRAQKISPLAFALLPAPLLGFYDGFFGPGTGSLMALAFVLLYGHGLVAATANAKLLNFVSNISALLYFIFYGDIIWLAGLAMIGGQLCGALLGAKMTLQHGGALIKPMVVIVCFAMSLAILIKF